MRNLVTIIFLFCMLNIQAKTIEGVNIPDSVTVGEELLKLNGAGVRTKFFMSIYAMGLYLPNKAQTLGQVLSQKGAQRIHIQFIYKKLSKKKIVGAWSDGFKDNLSSAELQQLKSKIQQFYDYFSEMKKGDKVLFDYVPKTGLTVILNDQPKGTITGYDFYVAVLKIWLGDDPADSSLKKQLLGK